MLPGQVVYLAAVIGLIGVVPYVRDTLAGNTQPHRVTWVLWAFIPLVTLVVQLNEHVGIQSLMTVSYFVAPILVVVASFVARRGSWAISTFDWCCAAVSVVALGVYVATRQGTITIILLLVADFFAAIPTVRKSFVAPKTETWQTYLAGCLASGLTLATVTNWTLATFALPAYIGCMNAFVVVLIVAEIGPRAAAARVRTRAGGISEKHERVGQ